jgi:tetratricopeptide (TPR) repeat protein
MTARATVTVATSIPPKLSRQSAGRAIGDEYQLLCIRSWLECGFRILSVNDRDEIPALASRYPEVAFVPIDRNASALSGRKNPFIADLLAALADVPAPALGIINSDIVFEPLLSWQRRLPELVDGGVVTGQRLDTMSLADGMLERHPWGFDFFFFNHDSVQALIDPALPFAMGLPWWDYWAPLTLALKGRRLTVVERPSIVHLYHDTAYDPVVWRQLAMKFCRLIVDQCEAFPPPLPPSLTNVFPLCREISAISGDDMIHRESTDAMMRRLADVCAKSICHDHFELTSDKDALADLQPSVRMPGTGFVPMDVFGRYQVRIAAGQAIVHAKKMQDDGRSKEAEEQFRIALQKLPDDTDALFYYGEYLLRQRNFMQAALVFRKLVGLRPEFCNAINCFGAVLNNMGLLDKAIACFERVLQLDPEFPAAYFNLAMALYKVNRHEAAIGRFEKMLAGRPDVAAGAETYWQLRQMLRGLNGSAGLQRDQYFSRLGEDALLDEFFSFKNVGCFVDIGAGDGVRFNNSYVFEQRGWSGFCFEEDSELHARCVKNRPHSHCERLFPEHLGAQGEIDFMSIKLEDAATPNATSALKCLRPRVVVATGSQGNLLPLTSALAAGGYHLARSHASSHFYLRDEADRIALRSIIVSAKVAPVAVPLHKLYVYWPAEPDDGR